MEIALQNQLNHSVIIAYDSPNDDRVSDYLQTYFSGI
jgi:hypothetical protein